METSHSKADVLDVAIVGGGVAGAYCAWRLMTAALPGSSLLRARAAARRDGKLKISLYEASKRIGGRLLSITPPGMPGTACELGGMRYLSSQTLVRSLVENKLRLETQPMPVSDPNNIAYVRGQHLRWRDLTDPEKVPYHLTPAERGRHPGTLLKWAIEQLIPGITDLHGDALQERLEKEEVEGRPLSDWGLWNLLMRAISQEAYEFARQSGGYDTTQLNWNAAAMIRLNQDFVPGVTFKRLVKGFEELPHTLCRLFQEAGGKVELHRRLESLDVVLDPGTAGDAPLIQMTFCKGEPVWNVDANQETETVLARALVLAMPRRSLELLDRTGAVLDPEAETSRKHNVRELIGAVSPIPMFKMFACYEYPWWEAAGVRQGRSVTDLPIRQCYYWGTEPESREAVIMATYDDTLNVDFWAGLRASEEKVPPGQKANAGSADWHDHEAPEGMIEEVQRQLVEMHGVRYAPRPYAAAYMDWSGDPFGGGANFWKINRKSWDLVPQIIQPVQDLPVYICGEAYSNNQGWVEGALQTAELVLEKLGLRWPDWVTEHEAPRQRLRRRRLRTRGR
jgi:flavin-dependent amine oxidoreductase